MSDSTNIASEFHIEARLYFEVRDSNIYGGAGSVGYASWGCEGIKDVSFLTIDRVRNTVSSFAAMLGVSDDCVRVISREEYMDATEDDET